MGMYDYINEYQVKCFYNCYFHEPYIEEMSPISTSGGDLVQYIDGQEVPSASLYYNYTKDFIILDHDVEKVVHLIHHNKVLSSIPLDDVKKLQNVNFKDYNRIITKHGITIKVTNLEEMMQFAQEENERHAEINKAYKQLSSLQGQEREEALQQAEKVVEENMAFRCKWVDNTDSKFQALGRVLACADNLMDDKVERAHYAYMKDYLISLDAEFISAYLNWLPTDQYRQHAKDIMKEVEKDLG